MDKRQYLIPFIENDADMVLAPCNVGKLIIAQYSEILFKVDSWAAWDIIFKTISQIAIKYLDFLRACVILKLL